MRLTEAEILLILEAFRELHGPGYAAGDVGKLQAKLSVMLEVVRRAAAAGAKGGDRAR